ncbi:hypothetical protein TanjilG_32407 [Lupinus angustifolius]|nr:hypothetical protein TanjilG_32407 [Lupinus angustifolius]
MLKQTNLTFVTETKSILTDTNSILTETTMRNMTISMASLMTEHMGQLTETTNRINKPIDYARPKHHISSLTEASHTSHPNLTDMVVKIAQLYDLQELAHAQSQFVLDLHRIV